MKTPRRHPWIRNGILEGEWCVVVVVVVFVAVAPVKEEELIISTIALP